LSRSDRVGSNAGGPHSPSSGNRGELETRNSKLETGSGPRITERPVNAAYVPESTDDYELGSEVVRHAQEVEDPRSPGGPGAPLSSGASARPGGPQLPSVGNCGETSDAPLPIDTVTTSVNIDYDANDLEVPAFLRKRGDS